MSRGGRITDIVVAGAGLVGVSAAALLKRRIPGSTVTLVGEAPGADALADRIGSTLPSAIGFHADLGLDERQLVQATGASFRLGTLFEGWSADRPSYVHAYGEYGRPIGIVGFHHHWVRQARAGKVSPFDAHSAAAMLGRTGRFVHPQGGADSPLGSFEYGLNLDPARYRALMQAYARHLGVIERAVAVVDVRLTDDTGFVEALRLADGGEIGGHLFVDCTGPAALIRSRLDARFDDWSHWLPCDRLLFARGPGQESPPPLDTVTAHAAGWRWESTSRAQASHGLVYSSAHLSDSKAERVLRAGAAAEPEAAPVALRAGCRPQPWLRNCVAIGDSAAAIEPLEWTNLHLAHSALDRLVAKMPDRDCSEVELWDYNRESLGEAERVRDFLVLHYVTADRPKDAFWREATAVAPPPSLEHSLTLFRERGRLPYYEEETFTRHSWAAVLLGQGVMPRRSDPLIDVIPPEQAESAMAQMRNTIAAMTASLPSQGDYLRQFAARSAQ